MTTPQNPDFALTAEQQEVVRLAATGDSFKIEAGAGTGKTTALVLIAAAAPERRGQYIAFNRDIVEEAKTKFTRNVKCSTAHSLAFATHGKEHLPRIKSSTRMKSADIAKFLGLEGMAVDVAGERKWLSPGKLAGVVLRAVEKFCQSADDEPSAKHVPFIVGIDIPPFTNGRRNYDNNNRVAAYLAPYVARAWADIRLTDGKLPSGHHVYLKLWQLSGPRIGADFIMFDEAQDASPVMVDVVSKQTHAQVIWVGDSQQEIYGFTGAINALATIETPHRTFLTKSFRFGSAIAAQANAILSMIEGAELRLEGHDPIPSVVAPTSEPDVVLSRTNAEAVRVVLETLAAGKTPCLVGGSADIVAFARGAKSLRDEGWSSHPDLACFSNWVEVQEYVEQDEQGGDLRLLVSLIDEFGIERILEALAMDVREEDADVVVSTAHKSKGREWGRVQLASDFPEDRGKCSEDELRLLYVACTRARLVLDISRVAILTGGLPNEMPPVITNTALADAPVVAEIISDQAALEMARALLAMNDQIRRLGVNLETAYAPELSAARTLVAAAGEES